MASEQPNPPPPTEEMVTLDLAYVFPQLQMQTSVSLEEVPVLTLPRLATHELITAEDMSQTNRVPFYCKQDNEQVAQIPQWVKEF
ncbi:hypothetical protein FQN55_001991 [Onygenales sp. PD_40]|nr:hypothetical protein FQN55_001991 [Onygenales sp. PD_40]KAK2775462.1 hypothetical protein FQN53_003147 [Emmonsiellopsis sp. PD_33]KAK2794823.1 hypothetical protein FQN51_000646 [Onygenales sp. PD_10]KAK2795679.1 hypothetical protein FQN52_003528 [Onygenales sp. PD_12]